MSAVDESIVNIIQKYAISDHAVLQEKLLLNGLSISQSTLSRKLKQLNVSKISGVYTIAGGPKNSAPSILDMQSSESGLIILHTHIGQASTVAYVIDQWVDNKQIGILGTIAGDDTVLVIVRSLLDVICVKSKLKIEFKIGDLNG